ncbi:PHP domain-containing protein [Methanococcus voltae]|uniref:PHP domain protein n=1 Tax=Methanococcus voltae (strain ATCC BAA-1334 / A3) TaxID=456320 RepID=D7DRZ6_METV3|nr:PHP domain-containing protein [Methanococcus voltae]MCS3901431.1 DNA polymerase (family 10)/putative hydrolase [Methanococcus voltae]
MKIWEKYEDYLLTGEWHVHTNYTDGKNTVKDLCEKATTLNIPLIAFTEHVRKNLNYDFNDFLTDIDTCKNEFPDLIILSGLEAKVLPDGTLDVLDDILNTVDYPIFAYHGFPKDITTYLETLNGIVSKSKFAKRLNTWAHPGLFFQKNPNLLNELDEDILKEIFITMKKNKILLEINSKYNLPYQNWINLAKNEDISLNFVKGSDIHDLNNLNNEKLQI